VSALSFIALSDLVKPKLKNGILKWNESLLNEFTWLQHKKSIRCVSLGRMARLQTLNKLLEWCTIVYKTNIHPLHFCPMLLVD